MLVNSLLSLVVALVLAQFPVKIGGGAVVGGGGAPLSITTTVLPQCFVGEAFSTNIVATGGSGTYSSFTLVVGSFPSGSPAFGIATVSNHGELTGTSDVEDLNNTFTIQVTDSLGATDTQNYTLDCLDAGSGDTPVLRTGHPRILFTPEGDTGYGRALDDWRSDIVSFYSADFQTFITTVNGLSTSPTGKGSATGPQCNTACADGIAFAFLAIADPAEFGSFSWGGRTQATYRAAAKAHALYIAEQMVRATDPWTETQDSENFGSDHQPSLALACIYDWTLAAGETYTDDEKRDILDAAVKNYAARTPRSADIFFASDPAYFTTIYPGIAFEVSEAPSGNATAEGVTQTYAEWVQEMQSETLTDWFDDGGTSMQQGWTGHLDTYFTTGHDSSQMAGWTLGGSYNEQEAISAPLIALLIGTAFNVNIPAQQNWWNTWGFWFLNNLRPAALATGSNGIRYEYRFGISTPFSGYQSGNTRYGFWGGAFLTNDDTMKRVMKWAAGTGYNNLGLQTNATQQVAFWPFFHFIGGMSHLGSAVTPTAAGLSTSTAFGNGFYFLRTGYESANDTLLVIHAPKTVVTSGHWRNDFSAFTIEKFGALVVNGGQNKGSGTVGFQAEDEVDQAKMGVIMAGENDVYKGLTGTTMARTGGMSVPNPGGSGYCGLGTYRCNVGNVQRIALAADSNAYDYLRYVYTGMWNSSKVSYSDREYVYLRGTTDHEYLVVLDRVTSVNSSFRKFWNAKHSFTPTSSVALTQIELGAGFTSEQGGIWTVPNTTTWTTTNATTINGDHTTHGKLFTKMFLPTGTWTRISGDFYEARDAATFAPYNRAAQTIKSSSSSGGLTTVVLASSTDSPDTGDAVLITGSSDANLNGYYSSVTRLTSTTFRVTCAACATGGAATLIVRVEGGDTGAEAFGRARLQFEPTTARTSDLFLSFMQWGDSNTLGGMTTTTLLCSGTVTEVCGGTLVGLAIDDSILQRVLLFSTNSQGGLPTLPATVATGLSGSTRVLVFNLNPDTTYHYTASSGSFELRTSSFGGSSSTSTDSKGILSVLVNF